MVRLGRKPYAAGIKAGKNSELTGQEIWDVTWSTAVIHLGLTDERFFSITPRQFFILMERRKEALMHQQLQTGILASVTCNHSFAPPKKPVSPADFMPLLKGSHKVESAPRLNRRRVANKIRGIFAAHNARLKGKR